MTEQQKQPDSPPAAPSRMVVRLMEIAGNYHLRQNVGALLPATILEMTAKEFDDALAPVREAMKHLEDLADNYRGVKCAQCTRASEVLLSLSPQPPEAKT